MSSSKREEILSVGIDLGTSTTQLVFSKLTVENLASDFAVPRVMITEKEIIYTSQIYFTPLIDNQTIDSIGVKEIIAKEYANAQNQAGIRKEEIKTGAVIITGETARKDNARQVLNMLSEFAGDFVVATAGPDLESVIAGKGAGADAISQAQRQAVVNIDIGGGTSNLALFTNGEVVDTGCLDVGGGLIKIDPASKKITYISPKVKEHLCKQPPLAVGDEATKAKLLPVIHLLVAALEQSVGLRETNELYQILLTNKGLAEQGQCSNISGITFSGGVAEIIYHPDRYPDHQDEDFIYGDIGVLLGKAIRQSLLFQKLQVYQGAETIRATVVGAGSHTMDISGSTICYENISFPIKSLPILKADPVAETDSAALAADLKNKLSWFAGNGKYESLAIGLNGMKNPSFQQVQQYAEAILEGMQDYCSQGLPLLIATATDMGKVLGNALLAKNPALKNVGLISLDGVVVQQGDYLDIGEPIAGGKVLPVVIKTLVFSGSGTNNSAAGERA